MTYVDFPKEKHRRVQVQLDDGVRCDGYPESYRRVAGVWSGFVRYSTEPAVNYLGWFDGPRILGH